MGTKYLHWVINGFDFNCNMLIFFVILAPMLIWWCMIFNKHDWPNVLRLTGSIIITWVIAAVFVYYGHTDEWWHCGPMMLVFGIGWECCRVWFDKKKFDPRSLLYYLAGTASTMAGFWLMN